MDALSPEEFDLNKDAYLERIADLHGRRQRSRIGGSEASRERHIKRGRMLPRARVDALLDPGSPFLELAELVADGFYDGVPPGGSMITGIGQVQGRHCMIIANDSTVKGGTYFGATVRKHTRAQRIAWENRLPCITLVDSGGAFLPDQENIHPDEQHFGSIFYNQVGMSAEGIAQIAVVLGPCTAGGAYIPSLCDEVVIVRGQGFMYLGGPELTKAATGEDIDRESLGGAQMHSSVSGVTDYIAENDEHALAITRDIMAELGEAAPMRWTPKPSKPPRLDPNEIYGLISRDARIPTDNREILLRMVDGSEFQEFKPLYGDTLVCGFARIHGFQIGILANQGVFFTEAALKGTQFIDICTKRDIPLLFLSDVAGFMVGREAEVGGIAKAGAKFVTAMSSAAVPKYTVVTGGAYGAGYLAMCSRQFKPRALFMWPHSRIAIMGPEQAANTLAMVKRKNFEANGVDWSEREEEEFKAPLRAEYERFADAYNFAANLWVDGVLDPTETRHALGLLLDVAARTPIAETNFGVFRM
ncbi:MAG: carboxyl transferase domain-containing protein [Alphaproteobacteria bacterium]|jgi:3-methylcrotonyl-CoA carboxylase beta subunit|nr:methylcrotonoyl-CoA carboxylase [Rhodospirillaceae bacterium]MDP6020082.1 carboxyl transferase domain-containing protein [Alphaproteobacteria bacterium]MDP6257058.1 carboxyl transferase domain-containing protein [Alphaproteobacteria bacterium]MDP7054083.1 carboxyl transferase domain-containing protein [Alphaproteobacteria bacterium]MDP7227394.1 carboxyl transferase domain-containing protein [Alphaproteobacteria bacterium]|tara:strand:- start:2371 stop:3960 length:1590 start_codon:yes stop_codon:yes gene_type:complete